MNANKQQAHALIDRVPADQLDTVRFLEFLLLDPADRASTATLFEDEEISEEEEAAAARSKEWFKHNQGTPFEQVVADCGFTMDHIRSNKALAD